MEPPPVSMGCKHRCRAAMMASALGWSDAACASRGGGSSVGVATIASPPLPLFPPPPSPSPSFAPRLPRATSSLCRASCAPGGLACPAPPPRSADACISSNCRISSSCSLKRTLSAAARARSCTKSLCMSRSECRPAPIQSHKSRPPLDAWLCVRLQSPLPPYLSPSLPRLDFPHRTLP